MEEATILFLLEVSVLDAVSHMFLHAYLGAGLECESRSTNGAIR